MRILLQGKTTLLYLRKSDHWTGDWTEAFDFGCAEKAVEFAHGQNLTDVQVIIALMENGYCQTVPLTMPPPHDCGTTRGRRVEPQD